MNHVVIGLGFGDEGKGHMVDYLCYALQSSTPLVVRFNGGHQAGHAVHTTSKSHSFSNFGSGTMRNVPTYWSRFCTVEPIGLLKELKILSDKEINPTLYIDEGCPITTPYEIDYNILTNAKTQHGTCGVGFGATIDREEHHYSITALDLLYPSVLKQKVQELSYYYKKSCALDLFYSCCFAIANNDKIKIVKEIPTAEQYVFEGAQGLLLDQNYGFFPNVTRSNTGLKNVLALIKDEPFDVYLVTRAYQTRHGNGFMTNEHLPHNIKINPLENNQFNEHQGEFRRALLDADLLKYAIAKITELKQARFTTLVITCLDHIENEYRFTSNGKLVQCLNQFTFVNQLSTILGISNIYTSNNNKVRGIKYHQW